MKELMKKAVEFKMPAVAITDHGNLFGAIEFYQEAQRAGVKPGFQIRRQNGGADCGIFRLRLAPVQTTIRFQKFVIAFESGNCYESACCGWLSIGKRRAMPTLLRHEKIGGHH